MTAARPASASPAPWIAFALGSLAIVLGARAVVASAAFRARPALLGAAVLSDLTLTVSALAWATLVHTGRAPRRSLLAVLSAGLAVAALVLPGSHRPAAWWVARAAVGALEAVVLVWLGTATWRVARRLRRRPERLPLDEALRLAASEAFGPRRSVAALAAEASMLGFALFSWRAAPHVPPGATAFPVHARSGLGAVLFALALAGVGETIGAHLLLARWSPTGAWIATAASIYTGLWLLGDYRALRLRPVLLREDALEVRIGLRWRAAIPRAAIRAVCAGPDPARHPGCVVASPLGPPLLYVHLDAPVEVAGPLGLRRSAACLGLRVDDPEALRRALGGGVTPSGA